LLLRLKVLASSVKKSQTDVDWFGNHFIYSWRFLQAIPITFGITIRLSLRNTHFWIYISVKFSKQFPTLCFYFSQSFSDIRFTVRWIGMWSDRFDRLEIFRISFHLTWTSS
jgi:hypothetical protein